MQCVARLCAPGKAVRKRDTRAHADSEHMHDRAISRQHLVSRLVMGSVTIGVGGNVSSLVWLPTRQSRTIGATRYELTHDNIGTAAGRGPAVPVNNLRGISTTVITKIVLELSTVVLLGTGFASFSTWRFTAGTVARFVQIVRTGGW